MGYTQVSAKPGNDHAFDVDLNAFEIGAAVAAAGIGCASIGITAVAAPTAVVIPGAFAGGMYLAGYNQRHGHLPFMGGKDAPAPAPTPGVVTNAAGTPVAVETI